VIRLRSDEPNAVLLICFNSYSGSGDVHKVRLSTKSYVISTLLARDIEATANSSDPTHVVDGFMGAVSVRLGDAGDLASHNGSLLVEGEPGLDLWSNSGRRRPATEAALRGSGFWRTAAKDPNAVARDRCFGPCAHKLEQELLLLFGLGLGNPKQGLVGILPELIGF
jgi:hypothetical protein